MIDSVIPVATAAYRYAVAVATVQFSRAAERALPADRHEGRPAGTGLSKLNNMLGLELGDMPRDARRRGRPQNAGRRLGRPGPVDVLAARSVSGGGDRGDEGHDLPHGAVPYTPHTGAP